ncbi:tRNA-dependent cyclodipeptide synthase [Streptomyces armeniacus]|uniref:Cyclodipeptide synthase n=1 Tax=Streptomyces armeniacus TaxID=83291 RepID=A0A345XQE2_9ACTN|nr:tRNA-dependent cyclodipeptide synthase [Streptomyces armeniacus]AXK33858.1 tRNA-dependent cyclodipeptide synthase [Streptomyces armeniacus]
MFDVEPLTAGCGELLPRATHVCIGVSPFNGYFRTPRITALAEWALRTFDGCHFFVPDTVAAYTLQAQGYPLGRARHKAQRQGQYVHNKVATALRSLAVPDPCEQVWGMDRLRRNARYAELLDEANGLFDGDRRFRDACLDASRWVLEHKLAPGAEPTREQLLLAVRYFLAELPLFADSGGIAAAEGAGDGGVSMFVYHQRVRFLERFYGGELPWSAAPGQGFLVVREHGSGPAPEAGQRRRDATARVTVS